MNAVLFENLASSLKGLHEGCNPFELARIAYSRLAGPLQFDVFFNYMVVGSGADLWLASYEGVPPKVARELSNLPFGTEVSGSVAETAKHQVFANIQHYPIARTELVRSLGVQAYYGKALNQLLPRVDQVHSFVADELSATPTNAEPSTGKRSAA